MSVSEKELEFWLRGGSDVVLECVEISHPSFSKTFRFVRNHMGGVRVKHGGRWHAYEYVPLTISAGSSADNLEQSFTMGIGEVGDILPAEVARIRNGNHRTVRPSVAYRAYLLSDLENPIREVVGLEVTDNQPKPEGAVFKCRMRELNASETGMKYTLNKYPTLRGFT